MDNQIKDEVISCQNCPKGVKDGTMFVKDGKLYCCGKCHEGGQSESDCQHC